MVYKTKFKHLSVTYKLRAFWSENITRNKISLKSNHHIIQKFLNTKNREGKKNRIPNHIYITNPKANQVNVGSCTQK